MKKTPTTFKSIAIRIIALALSLWLCVVGLVTWAVAEDYFHQIDTITKHFPDILNTARNYPVHEQEELPGSAEARMIYIMSWPYLKLHTKHPLEQHNELVSQKQMHLKFLLFQ